MSISHHKGRTGFFELPALGARTVALVAGQAGEHRAREKEKQAEWVKIIQHPDRAVSVGGVARVELGEWGPI